MGLLDELKPTEQPGTGSLTVSEIGLAEGNPNSTDTFDKFKVQLPVSTEQKLFNQIKQTPNIAKEGIQGGNDAADALFNNNTSSFSRALSSRAAKMMTQNKAARTLNNELTNIKRQQLQQNQDLSNLNDIYKIKRQNFAAQLGFAAQMSDYYNALSAAKLQVLGSVVGGVGGFIVGGPAGAAAGSQAGGSLAKGMA